MTRKPFTLFFGILILLCSSVAYGQDYSFRQFNNESSFISDSVAGGTAVNISRLPADFVSPVVATTTPARSGDAADANFAANLAVLAAFASLLGLGGIIVAYVGYVRKKARSITPMRMVGA